MPLKKTMTHGEIVAEILRDWKRDGMIGNIRPRNLEHAMDIANAIAYRMTRERSTPKKRKRRSTKS